MIEPSDDYIQGFEDARGSARAVKLPEAPLERMSDTLKEAWRRYTAREAFLPLDYEERYFRELHGMSTADMGKTG